MKRRAREVEPAARLGVRPHEHPDRGRGRVPDGDLLILQDPVPALRIEVRLVDDARDAVQAGRRCRKKCRSPSRDRRCTRRCRPGWKSRANLPVMKWVRTALWTCTAPFGIPVVPLVKWRTAMSSGSVRRSECRCPAFAIEAVRKRGFGHRSRSSPAADEQDVLQLRQAVQQPPPLSSHTAVRWSPGCGPPVPRRCRIGSGPKAENRGQKTLVLFRVPRAAK